MWQSPRFHKTPSGTLGVAESKDRDNLATATLWFDSGALRAPPLTMTRGVRLPHPDTRRAPPLTATSRSSSNGFQ